ncbi:MAG: protease inhibitor I42 family protein [Anaerolineales bacterium]|jgi:inhibitor of cysteine peptidase
MTTRAVFLFLLCGLGGVLAACGQPNEGPVKVTENNAGSTVELHQGQTLKVELQGNPTTGYTWEVLPGAESILEQQGEAQLVPESQAVGAGGLVTLTFKAVRAGQATLSLVYHRTFELGVPPLRTFELTVVVAG